MKSLSKHLMMLTLLFGAGWQLASAQSAGANDPAARLGLSLVEYTSRYDLDYERNHYENTLQLYQPDNKLTAGMLHEGNNYIVFHRQDARDGDTEFARINLNAVKTTPQSEVIDMLDFYQDGDGAHSGTTTITQAMLGNGSWGTNGTNLIWQASGYAYISGAGGFTYTVPAGYNNAMLQFIIYVGPNARGGYFAYNYNNEGWSIAATASANGVADFVVDGVSTGDVISFYGARVYNNNYQLYQSPDIELFGVLEMPQSYVPTIEVTPTKSEKSNGNWGEPSPIGNSMTLTPNDQVNLAALGTITDTFDEPTSDNTHPESYTYSATFDANVVLPEGSSTGMDFQASADFSACTTSNPGSAAMTGYDGWSFNESYAYSSGGIISMYIQFYGAVIFTMPDTFMGNSVNVTITTSTGTDGAGIVLVNGQSHTFTAGSTYTWTVPVTAGGIIEFKSDGQTYSADITRIIITNGNGNGMSAPAINGKGKSSLLPRALKAHQAMPVETQQFKSTRNNKVKIND